MNVRAFGIRLVGATLAIGGSLLWSSRLDYEPERVLEERVADRLVEVAPGQLSDLSNHCGQVLNPGGWMLFVMDARLLSDTKFRTYFETAEERVGLWVEYDSGLLRLGLGLGPESPDSNTEVPIRWVRRDESATVFIAVSREETRVITNAVDKSTSWPGSFAESWRCNGVQVGSDSRKLSEGSTCAECNVRLRYVSGRSSSQLNSLLGQLSNVRIFNQKRITGSALVVVGTALMLFGHRISSFSQIAQRNRLHR